jgi:hypothetical protein
MPNIFSSNLNFIISQKRKMGAYQIVTPSKSILNVGFTTDK